jgi:hypothetical protein
MAAKARPATIGGTIRVDMSKEEYLMWQVWHRVPLAEREAWTAWRLRVLAAGAAGPRRPDTPPSPDSRGTPDDSEPA